MICNYTPDQVSTGSTVDSLPGRHKERYQELVSRCEPVEPVTKADARKKQHDDLEQARQRGWRSQSVRTAPKAERAKDAAQSSVIAKANKPALPSERRTRMRNKGPDAVQQTGTRQSVGDANVQETAARTRAASEGLSAQGKPLWANMTCDWRTFRGDHREASFESWWCRISKYNLGPLSNPYAGWGTLLIDRFGILARVLPRLKTVKNFRLVLMSAPINPDEFLNRFKQIGLNLDDTCVFSPQERHQDWQTIAWTITHPLQETTLKTHFEQWWLCIMSTEKGITVSGSHGICYWAHCFLYQVGLKPRSWLRCLRPHRGGDLLRDCCRTASMQIPHRMSEPFSSKERKILILQGQET